MCPHKPAGTKYYHLPMWKENDVTSWMYGLNTAMMMIDDLFHHFSLRTGIDGIPEDLLNLVSGLEASVGALRRHNENLTKDVADSTKVLANVLASMELINNKIQQLNFNYSNVDTRLKSAELKTNDFESQVNKITENLSSIMQQLTEFSSIETKISEIEERVTALENKEE